jgi:hypothetical protein
VDELTLFPGHTGQLGSYSIWLGTAWDSPLCSADEFEGEYEYFVAQAPP